MRFAEAARAAPGEHLGATKGKAAVVELPHIHSLLRDVVKLTKIVSVLQVARVIGNLLF